MALGTSLPKSVRENQLSTVPSVLIAARPISLATTVPLRVWDKKISTLPIFFGDFENSGRMVVYSKRREGMKILPGIGFNLASRVEINGKNSALGIDCSPSHFSCNHSAFACLGQESFLSPNFLWGF
ncbi:hypothetical protein CDAR_173521 [Caerostris darwini]|uniref:Uncharacterized protein n=1 Tax=Caerostris darwini TaxID=1538125 RepID=A0AAV4SEU3_9ARAC|nr:hypothetical protein CDAR_173521 [Caerostris darwini]